MHPSKLPSQAHLNNVFLSYMQNSDEYLQHPGIGTTGRKKKNDDTLPTHPNPQVQSFSKCSPNKLFWLPLPGNNPTAVFSPSTCKAGVLSAQSVYSQDSSRDGKWDVRRVKVRVKSANGRDPKINLKHYLWHFPPVFQHLMCVFQWTS